MREREHGESKLRGLMSLKVVFTVVAVVLVGWRIRKRTATVAFCDESDLGFGWVVDEFMERCSHALLADARVWLVDPVADEAAEERARGLGEPAGVIQLLDRHGRDCADLARRLGVPRHEVPYDGIPGSPFEVLGVANRRRWKEVALWWPERRVLVCADALGTARYYRSGDERLAVNPLLRLTPPMALGQVEPEAILVGHGAGIDEGAAEALHEALGTARRRAPGLAVSWLRHRRSRRLTSVAAATRQGAEMKLEGIHHVTAITADAPRNVDFYARVLGLRLVKKTVNQDDPTVYHLFYADELGSPGSDITFFEYPGMRGRPGAGMVHTVAFRVPTAESLDFWAGRLGAEGVTTDREGNALRFADPEGLGLELRVVDTTDRPLVAEHPEVPREHAIQGFDGVRAYTVDPVVSAEFLENGLGFERLAEGEYEVRGANRGGLFGWDRSTERGLGGAGTVHHVAFGSPIEDHDAWRRQALASGAHPTPVIDRFYFKSIYFREPGGVLFEIATDGPGFTADEPLETLGEHLSLPPNYEHLRDQLEPVLTPLPNPRPQAVR